MSRVCVIGAGLGGLALAIRLQSADNEVTLIEARDRVGGHASAHESRGFRFENGPEAIGVPDDLVELWHMTGHELRDDVELLPVEPIRRLNWPDGTTLDLSGDGSALRREIARIAPDDIAGYEELLSWSAQALREGRDRLQAEPPHDLGSLLRASPVLARYQAWRSPYRQVSRFIRSEKLREALTVQAIATSGNPMAGGGLRALAHKFECDHGAWWPKGGMGGLAAAMARHFERLGGKILLHDPVVHIHLIGDRADEVETIGGWRQRFDAVASNADIVHTYRDLLAGTQRGMEMARRLVRQRFGPSFLAVHFGLEGSWPGIPHSTVLFGPRYRALLEDIFEHGVLPRDQLIFLCHPSITDPSAAPPGKSTFRALIPVANQAMLPIDWEQAGPMIERRILDEVGRRLIPDLDDRIVTRWHVSPRDFALDFNVWAGSAFGLQPAPGQNLLLQVSARDAKIRNLYFAGGAVQSGAGTSGTLTSAARVAKRMVADLRGGRT